MENNMNLETTPYLFTPGCEWHAKNKKKRKERKKKAQWFIVRQAQAQRLNIDSQAPAHFTE